MIYKNDKLVTLQEIGITKANILKMYKKWPIVIDFPEERIKSNPKNQLPDKPTSVKVPYVATVKTKEHGVVNYRYAERMSYDTNGNPRYHPTHFEVKGRRSIDENEWELVWWLYHCCPYLKNGKNFNGNIAKFEIIDLASKADRDVEKIRKESRYNTLLFDADLGLSHDSLKDIAKAMFIDGTDDMVESQIRMAINTRVRADKRDGVDKFLNLTNAGEMIKVRARIQIAKEKKIVKYEPKKKRWVWVVEGGRDEEIVTIGNKHPDQALYDYMSGNRQFAENIYNALRELKFITEDLDEE